MEYHIIQVYLYLHWGIVFKQIFINKVEQLKGIFDFLKHIKHITPKLMTIITNSVYESVIAILDNDPVFANTVQNFLSHLTFQNVKIFKNTAELEQSNYNPTIIITEFTFKTITGIDVIEKLKKHYKDALIFVISNTKRISASLLSIVSGASIFLRKKDFLENKNILFEKIGTWVEKQKPVSLMVEESFNNIEKKVLEYERQFNHC